jgi:hypothetical protein
VSLSINVNSAVGGENSQVFFITTLYREPKKNLLYSLNIGLEFHLYKVSIQHSILVIFLKFIAPGQTVHVDKGEGDDD